MLHLNCFAGKLCSAKSDTEGIPTASHRAEKRGEVDFKKEVR